MHYQTCGATGAALWVTTKRCAGILQPWIQRTANDIATPNAAPRASTAPTSKPIGRNPSMAKMGRGIYKHAHMHRYGNAASIEDFPRHIIVGNPFGVDLNCCTLLGRIVCTFASITTVLCDRCSC